MYLSSFVVSSPFLAAIDLTGRGGTTLWLAAAIVATVLTAGGAVVPIAGLATATVLLLVVTMLDVDAAVGWTACCRQAPQLLGAALGGHALASSVRELILRWEPLQLLPHEIFTEQLILSYQSQQLGS